MPGVAHSMKIIMKNLVCIPFIGDSADFVLCSHETAKNLFSVKLCVERTDFLIFLNWCFQFLRKVCFPGDGFRFFQKISLARSLLETAACSFRVICASGYNSPFFGTASDTGISGSTGKSGNITYL